MHDASDRGPHPHSTIGRGDMSYWKHGRKTDSLWSMKAEEARGRARAGQIEQIEQIDWPRSGAQSEKKLLVRFMILQHWQRTPDGNDGYRPSPAQQATNQTIWRACRRRPSTAALRWCRSLLAAVSNWADDSLHLEARQRTFGGQSVCTAACLEPLYCRQVTDCFLQK
jgi:hypothetical protein